MAKLQLIVTSVTVGHQQAEITPLTKCTNLIMEDRRLTIQEIANEVEISHGSAHAILTDALGIRRVAVEIVPKLL